MELFVPSLVVLLLSTIVCFFILPNLAPYVLGGLAIAMFGLGFWQHYTMFPYEYRTSLFTDLIRDYAGFFMSLAVILASITTMLAMYGGNTPSGEAMAIEMPEMPEIPPIAEIPVIAEMPAMFGFNNTNKPANNTNKPSNNTNKPANNANKPANNANKPANNANKKNNLASTSFKVV
jgi:hypothetical protein